MRKDVRVLENVVQALPHDAFPLIVIGGSAGSIPVIQGILSRLPEGLPAAVFVVVHQAETGSGSLLPAFARSGPLKADEMVDGAVIRPGRIYVALPGRHLLVEGNRMRLTKGPRENGFRPSVDALFRTAACSFGARTIGVILSGYLDDGTIGLLHVRRAGGVTIVQDPLDAAVPDMPASSLRYAQPDHVLPADAIAALLVGLVANASAPPAAEIPTSESELAMAEPNPLAVSPPSADHPDTAIAGDSGLTDGTMPGKLSGLTCPACGGAMWETDEHDLLRFQCHVGHRYTAEAFANATDNQVEAALWTALRSLQERASTYRRLAIKANQTNASTLASRYWDHVREAEQQANIVRRLVLGQLVDESRTSDGHA